MTADKKSRRYISYRESWLRDKFLGQAKPKTKRCCPPMEEWFRCLQTVKFLCICGSSLFQVLAPWVLCSIEVIAVLLIYLLGTTRSIAIHETPPSYHFSYMHSLEDIVGLACVRSALLSSAYAAGMQHLHRPYLYASYLLAASCFPYIMVKMILFRYSNDAVPAAGMFIITGLFSWVHVFAARRTRELARRRYQMGLATFGYPWEQGEEAWGMLNSAPHVMEGMSKNLEAGAMAGYFGEGGTGTDVPAEDLADADSKFILVSGIKVHYKEVIPSCASNTNTESMAIVLVHGFGGGVFAWRHVMEHLAIQCQCRVIAFDRPAFGLTSRPSVSKTAGENGNPYSIGTQAHLLMDLCVLLGLQQVILAAHADGCLLALRAASLASRSRSKSFPVAAELLEPQTDCGSIRHLYPAEAAPYVLPSSFTQPWQQEASLCMQHPSSLSLQVHQQHQHIGSGENTPRPGTSRGPSGSHTACSSQGGAQPCCGSLPVTLVGSAAATAGSPGSLVRDATSPSALGLESRGPGQDSERYYNFNRRRPLKASGHLTTPSRTGSSRRSSCSESVQQPSACSSGEPSLVSEGLDAVPTISYPQSGLLYLPGARGVGPSTCLHPPSVAGTVPAVDSSLPPKSESWEQGGGIVVCSAEVAAAGTAGPGSSCSGSGASLTLSDGTRHRRSQSMPGPLFGSRNTSQQGSQQQPCTKGISHCQGGGALTPPSLAWGGARLCSPPGCAHELSFTYGPSSSSQPMPEVLGLALLHPNMSGQTGLGLSRLLARTSLGRSILRPLLRSEVGEVANRRAWHNTHKLTPEVLEMYKAPLRVEGWCESLIETTRLGAKSRGHEHWDLAANFSDARNLPALLLTGEHDRLVPPVRAEQLCVELPYSRLAIVHNCGHLSHEEAPASLLQHLTPFCSQVVEVAAMRRQSQHSRSLRE